jgi:hypothetical protein
LNQQLSEKFEALREQRVLHEKQLDMSRALKEKDSQITFLIQQNEALRMETATDSKQLSTRHSHMLREHVLHNHF